MTFPQNYPNGELFPAYSDRAIMLNSQFILMDVCISILRPPGAHPNGYDLASEPLTVGPFRDRSVLI
ncbi:hypothetical protein EJB05_35032, partial [Eragrostis curvula]